MPSVFNKITNINNILNKIFNDDIDNNIKTKQKQTLNNLYKQYKHIYGVDDKFTELLMDKIKSYYKKKCNKLLNNGSLTFNSYLKTIEKYINNEKKQLFPYIDEYCSNNDINNIIHVMLNEFININDSKIKKLMDQSQNDDNNFIVKRIIYNDKYGIIDTDRAVNIYNLLLQNIDIGRSEKLLGHFWLIAFYTRDNGFAIYKLHECR